MINLPSLQLNQKEEEGELPVRSPIHVHTLCPHRELTPFPSLS